MIPTQDQRLWEATEEVIQVAEDRVAHRDEVFLHCLVCGDWDGHKDDCFIPAAKKWLKENQ